MNKFFKPIIIVAVVAVVALLFVFAGRQDSDFSHKYAGYDLTGASTGRTNTYSRYMERYVNAPVGQSNIPINIFAYSSSQGVSVLEDFQNEPRVLRTEESSFVEYSVNVDSAGLYNFYMEYHPLPSRGIPIERALLINGEIPFLGADRLSFQRVWGDARESTFDNQGNEIRPSQVEKPRWESSRFRDSLGFIVEPYTFYLREGENIIRMEGINEPVIIRALSIMAPAELQPYREALANIDTRQFSGGNENFLLKIQGERSTHRSDPSLYPIYDRSSGATEPASVARIRLNMIGGQSWRVAGQWIEWDFDVPEDGMYRITIKGRQNYNRGFVSNRTVLINGHVPYSEFSAVPFSFSNRWNLLTLQDNQGDILVPLESGSHTIRLQATLGGMGEMLNTMEESVYRLNAIYRKILVLTGPEPDIYRDYRVDHVYPEIMTAMDLESKILYKLVDDLTSYTGERSAQTAATLTLARQLELFVRRPDKIPRTLVNFKGNISSLGDSLLGLAQSQLDIDYIVVSGEESVIPPVRENFFVAAAHEIKSFFMSFFVNYSDIGDKHAVGKDPNVISVWMIAGRDQSSILKAMIDDTFTPLSGIKVNVRLVAADAVMPAVVAGTGPDIVLTVPQGEVINYAIRKAVVDISRFPGYEEAVSELNPEVLIPFTYGGGVWGLPETQYFHVMYYRKDIFEELDLQLPDTWDDLINILPIIQKNNMNVGIPSVANSDPARGVMPDFSNFMAHLFQRGGRLYNEEGSRALLDTEIAIDAFDIYTKFYTHYKTPIAFDFVNRFRTGEMPLAFADYTNFNTLEVFAPELRGLWGFARMPGLKRLDADGNEYIDRSVSTGTIASMIISASERQEQAWEFMKWWVSSGTQLRYGRELESIMGAAARYPTANYEAFKQLAWGSEQMAVLDEQRNWTVGTPEVPGGYFVSRHIVNAVRRILNEGQDTRETLLDYTITINDELIKKRKEFGLE